MPQYNYHCKDCESGFSIYASMSDSRENILCETCQSNNVYRVYSRILMKGGGFTGDQDAALATAASNTKSSGCGSCSSSSCSPCH